MKGNMAAKLAMFIISALALGFFSAAWGSADSRLGLGAAGDNLVCQVDGGNTSGLRHSFIIDAQEGRRGELETGLDMHYNRVDGLFIQLGVDTKWRPPARLRLFTWGGYAFGAEVWRYEIGLERWFDLGPWRMEVGVRNYDLTFTEDEWLMPTVENTAAALFFREDFRDYYRRTGTSFHLINSVYDRFSLEVAYLFDEHDHVVRTTNWSLFGGDKKFRENPPADEGKVHSLLIRLGYDTRDDFMEPNNGFLAEGTYQKAGDGFGGDYDFERFLLDCRRYQYLSRYENIDLRLRVGSASGDLPVQLAYDLGGIGSLRGYKHKEFRDFDRVVLGNVEYRIQFGRLTPGFLEDYQIIPFYDFGSAWSSNDNSSLMKGFDQLRADRLKTSIGLGLSTGADDRLRINLARRLDDRDRSMVVTVRIYRIF